MERGKGGIITWYEPKSLATAFSTIAAQKTYGDGLREKHGRPSAPPVKRGREREGGVGARSDGQTACDAVVWFRCGVWC